MPAHYEIQDPRTYTSVTTQQNYGWTTNYDWTRNTDAITNAIDSSSIRLHVRGVKEQVEEEMDKYARRIYNLIKDLVALNVSEDEFVELLKDENEE